MKFPTGEFFPLHEIPNRQAHKMIIFFFLLKASLFKILVNSVLVLFYIFLNYRVIITLMREYKMNRNTVAYMPALLVIDA